jgi:hypothetical protein
MQLDFEIEINVEFTYRLGRKRKAELVEKLKERLQSSVELTLSDVPLPEFEEILESYCVDVHVNTCQIDIQAYLEGNQ